MLITYGLESLLGFAGTGLAAFILVLIGNSTAGGASNQEFLPNVFRQIAQALPNGAFGRFIRNTVYFDGNHTGVALARDRALGAGRPGARAGCGAPSRLVDRAGDRPAKSAA